MIVRLFLLALLLGPVPALASGAMPQLDTASFAPQLFWLAVCFGALLLLLQRVGLPGITAVVDDRAARIARDLATAEAAQREAEAVLADLQRNHHQARQAGHDLLQQTMAELAQRRQQQEASLQMRLTQQVSAAETHLAQLRQQALAQAGMVVAELVQQIGQQLAGVRINPEQAAAAGNRALGLEPALPARATGTG